MELKDIKGFGPKRIEALKEKNILSPLDLLKIEPSKYLDYEITEGIDKKSNNTQTVEVEIVSVAKSAYFRGKSIVTVKVVDCISNEVFTAVWYNQPFIKNNLTEGEKFYLTGKMNKIRQFTVQSMVKCERIEDSIIPIYSKSLDLNNATIRMAVKQILDNGENYSVISNAVEKKHNLMELNKAFSELHFPSTIENLQQAKDRIALEDMMLLSILEQKLKNDTCEKERIYNLSKINEFKSECPFSLTEDQDKVLSEIIEDMSEKSVMNRMLLGDVGSGKTVVALGACYLAIKSGYQAVILCPTEILAEQHFSTSLRILGKNGIKISLLHSGLKGKDKEQIINNLKMGEVDLLISTHSSLSDKVEFKNLGLVITDEQHRFGVGERAKIASKGNNPDVLVMSATPIPRSLSLVLFGGLEVSEIKSRPAGESKIKTKIVPQEKEEKMWEFICESVEKNQGKCFVVVPRVEETTESKLYSVSEMKKRLVEYGVDGNTIAMVHGKMDKIEAGKEIELFKKSEKNILIGTTIIEVGIDIPDANYMVIYNAERFGLATLHQLRGRVGRNGKEGYCFVLSNEGNETSIKRLQTFKECNSGIKLAEEDLKIRGAGTLYGTKQHGASEVFLNLNFSVERYKFAGEIIKQLPREEITKLVTIAEERFGDIYKKVVLN